MISIIIPTLKEEGFIERTLKNLALLGEYPHEVIVSDGGSKDKTLEIVRRYTNHVAVYEGTARQSFGAAKNAGAALARGEYLVFIDADVDIPEPRAFFKEAAQQFEKNPGLVAMTVPLKPWKENHSPLDTFFTKPLNWWYILSNNWLHVGNASGEFQMFRHAAFKKVEGYREDLMGGEDTDMFYRVSRIGRTLSYSKLAVYHSCRRAHKTGWLKLYYMWMRQGFTVLFLQRTAYKEWSVIR